MYIRICVYTHRHEPTLLLLILVDTTKAPIVPKPKNPKTLNPHLKKPEYLWRPNPKSPYTLNPNLKKP